MLQTRKLFTLMSLLLTLGLTGCASDPASTEGADSLVDASSLSLELNGSSDENTAGPLQSVFFPFNSSELSGSTKSALENNANWLKLTDKVDIQIEGHCDERGGHQYNLALGERRARASRDYLIALGIDESRISIISYGKEKPVSFGHGEDSWGKNRRANFTITSK